MELPEPPMLQVEPPTATIADTRAELHENKLPEGPPTSTGNAAQLHIEDSEGRVDSPGISTAPASLKLEPTDIRAANQAHPSPVADTADEQGVSAAEDMQDKGGEAIGPGIRHLAEEDDLESGEGSEKPEVKPKLESLVRRMAPKDAEELRTQWEELRADVEALHHVGSFSVVSIAYRRYADPD